jgi:hypothetical protein
MEIEKILKIQKIRSPQSSKENKEKLKVNKTSIQGAFTLECQKTFRH